MKTNRYSHSCVAVSRHSGGAGRSRGDNLFTAAIIAALILLRAGLFTPEVRAQVPGPVQGWAAALDQTPSRSKTEDAGFTLDRTEHDFGQVALGDTVSTVFKLRAGDAPVVLLSATTDCGCTWAEFPKRPLRPGDTAQVKVIFVAKDRGNFRKTVRLRINVGGREHTVSLVVRGTVK